LARSFFPNSWKDFFPPKSGKRPFARRRACYDDGRKFNREAICILLKVQATDRAKLMLMALEAGLGQADRQS
jgi:hypothetical protein